MNLFGRLWWTAKGVNWRNLPRRLLQSWRIRSGLLRKRLDPDAFSNAVFESEYDFTPEDQSSLWRQKTRRFFAIPSADDLQKCTDGQQVDEAAEKALAGEYLFFNHWFGNLGWPPNFNRDPVNDIDWPAGEHWLGTARSGPPRDDIKLVWEASRFSLAYHFARAYVRSSDKKWANSFWEMFDAWIEQNPPQMTVAWGCGQEITFRLMAMIFAAIATLKSSAATDERLYALSRFAWQSGKHIDININQARMQGNNHALSEAVCVWTIGLLFPEFKESGKWRDLGAKVLACETRRQIYNDGSYVQHSLNYHRVMMDDLIWAIRLGEINNAVLPKTVHDRFARAVGWLREMADPDSGRVPNYGSNDGALVLPLSSCDYLDYRPIIQASHYLLRRQRFFEPGCWDEKMLWLFGAESLNAPKTSSAKQPQFAANDGGYYILRGDKSHAMIRCHSYKNRPSQADMLHLDIWHEGQNVLRDAGSYLYYCQEPWKMYFRNTAAHNTVEIDGLNQMVKGPKFLWFNWAKGNLISFGSSSDGKAGYFEGNHLGYKRLPGKVIHSRSVCRIEDSFIVSDQITGAGSHRVALNWRLCPADWNQSDNSFSADLNDEKVTLKVLTLHGQSCNLEMVESWESLYYGQRTQCPGIRLSLEEALPVRFITLIDFNGTLASINSIDDTDRLMKEKIDLL